MTGLCESTFFQERGLILVFRYVYIIAWVLVLLVLLMLVTAPFVLSSMSWATSNTPSGEVVEYGFPDTLVSLELQRMSNASSSIERIQIHWAAVANFVALGCGWTAVISAMIGLKCRQVSLRKLFLLITTTALFIGLGKNTLLFWALIAAALLFSQA